MRYDVYHVGIAVADMPLKLPPGALDLRKDTIALDDLSIMPGGDAANAAIVMARLGKSVALSAKVGDDPIGRMLRETIEQSGVDASYLAVDASRKTGMTVVLINARGERTFLIGPDSSNAAFALSDVDTRPFKMTKHVNFGSLFSNPKFAGGDLASFFRQARESGATTSADVTHDVGGVGYAGIREGLRYVDYFLPSYVEGRYLSGESEPEAIADFFLRETGDKTIVLKLGEKGCFIKSEGKSFTMPGYSVNAVDTTGAGDNFVAGFLYGVTSGWELERCAEFGNAVGALSVRHVGATSPDLTLRRVEEFMRNTPHI